MGRGNEKDRILKQIALSMDPDAGLNPACLRS